MSDDPESVFTEDALAASDGATKPRRRKKSTVNSTTDRLNAGPLGSGDRRALLIPRKAKRRRVMTLVGEVTVFTWRASDSVQWRSLMRRPPDHDVSFLRDTYHEAVAEAVTLARWRYGKPKRVVGAKVRFAVLERDGFRCRYCGRRAGDVELTLDHAISIDDGGSNDFDNLVTACSDCNVGKGRRTVRLPR